MTNIPVLIRAKGATAGYVYIRKGRNSYVLRRDATRFSSREAAITYMKRARFTANAFVIVKA